MKYSSRNVYEGKVKAIKKGPVNSEVALELPGGMEVVATLTTQSVERLGLKEGGKATAMIKATSVILATE